MSRTTKRIAYGVILACWLLAASLPAAAKRHHGVTSGVTARLLTEGAIHGQAAQVRISEGAATLAMRLGAGAARALQKPTFKARNRSHARIVGAESALLTAHAVGISDPTSPAVSALTRIFTQASTRAGKAFAGAFNPDGSKNPAKEAEYNKAMNAAGGIALDALPDLASALSGKKNRPTARDRRKLTQETGRVLASTRVEDLVAIVVNDLGLHTTLTGQEVIQHVSDMIPKDNWAYGDIGRMKIRAAGEQPLASSQLSLLDACIRLPNATWKAGQVHRAAWEGNTSRIDPTQRGGVYNPYDVLKAKLYNDTLTAELQKTGDQGLAQKRALSRVVFEVYKDLKQLTP